MADDSDEEQPKRLIENQPYDELLEVPDAEDVASIYTPTPRNPKNSQKQLQQGLGSRNQQQQLTVRPTPPPNSSSGSSQSIEDNGHHNQDLNRNYNNKMNDLSPSETPKNDDPHNQMQQMNDSGSEGHDGSDDDSQENFNELQGGYDPAAFRDLPVSSEISDIFKFIERYQPQTIELEFKLKPFIPDYIPSIGDIDAFLKVNRPDGKEDNLGFIVVDEPSSNQSDPHVLDLFFRTLSKQSTNEVRQPSAIKSVESNNTKAVDSWIRNISALQKNKPVQTVNYQRSMPNIDSLMQVWTPEFEELLKEVSLPSPELNVDLNTYTDIICSLLDIPVYKSRTQSIHVLMTLFSEFKNSEHFKNGASANFRNKNATDGRGGADKLVID